MDQREPHGPHGHDPSRGRGGRTRRLRDLPTGEWLYRAPRTDPPKGLLWQPFRDETKSRGRHSDEWWHLKGLEEADHEDDWL